MDRPAKRIPTVAWIHCCDYATLGENGKGILIGLFDRIDAEKLPLTLPNPFYVVFKLIDGQGEFQAGLRIQTPAKKHHDFPPRPVVLTHPLAGTIWVGGIQGFTFCDEGPHMIIPTVDGTPLPEFAERIMVHVKERPEG